MIHCPRSGLVQVWALFADRGPKPQGLVHLTWTWTRFTSDCVRKVRSRSGPGLNLVPYRKFIHLYNFTYYIQKYTLTRRGTAPPHRRIETVNNKGDSPSHRCVEKEVEGEGESPSSLARSNHKQRGGGQPLPPLG